MLDAKQLGRILYGSGSWVKLSLANMRLVNGNARDGGAHARCVPMLLHGCNACVAVPGGRQAPLCAAPTSPSSALN